MVDWQHAAQNFTRPIVTLGGTPVSLATVLQFVLLIFVTVLLSLATRRVLRRRLLPRTRLEPGLQEAAARLAGFMVLALGFAVGLSTVGFDLTSLTVLAGSLGIGIGFGLQTIVENFISGLIIVIERPIQIGHRVEVGSTAGRVTRIGARSTSILTNDNIVMIIPNSEFIKNRVTNWSHGGDSRVRIHVEVGVSYSSDPSEVERLLLEVAAADRDVLQEPAPRVSFETFGDSALKFELRVWTGSMSQNPGAFRSQLNFAIWRTFKSHGVEIPFPQRDLNFKAPLQVHVRNET